MNIKRERSHLVIISVYIAVFVLSVVTAVFNVGLDLNEIGSSKFIGNLARNYFISIIVVMASMRDSENRELLKAYHLDASSKLLNTLSKIRNRGLESMFRLYAKHRYKCEWQEFIDSNLFKAGISKEIYNLSDQDLRDIRKKNKFYLGFLKTLGKIFKSIKVPDEGTLSKDKYNLIMYLKHGKFKLREVKAEEILSEYDKEVTYQNMRSNRSRIIASSLGPKLVILFATSAIFTATIFNGSKNVGQVLTDLIMGIMGIVTAIFSGYFIGPELVGDKVRLKSAKDLFCCDFLSSFDSGAYRPTEEEMKDDVVDKILSKNEEPKTADQSNDEIELTEEEWKVIEELRKNPSH